MHVCALSLPALVVAASLQRDLYDLVPHAHVQLASAVQDEQAPDGLPLPGREELDLLQQAAPSGMIEGGQHLPDSAVIWKGRSRWMEECESMGGRRAFCLYEKRRRGGEVEEWRSGTRRKQYIHMY